jgi:hypothetical protein
MKDFPGSFMRTFKENFCSFDIDDLRPSLLLPDAPSKPRCPQVSIPVYESSETAYSSLKQWIVKG